MWDPKSIGALCRPMSTPLTVDTLTDVRFPEITAFDQVKQGLRQLPQSLSGVREKIGKKELFIQKKPGQLLPAGTGKIAIDIIAQVATVGCQRADLFLDDLVEVPDFLVQVFTGLIPDH